MNRKFVSFFVFALLAATAFAANDPANDQPVVATTFKCNGNANLGIGVCPEGGRPDALILGTDGNFYGAAQVSQEGSSTPTGGVVFSLTSAGTTTVLHTFAPGANKDYPGGNLPGPVVEGKDGNIYGVTLFGGVGGCNGYCGNGVLYRVSRTGKNFQILHEFCSQSKCADGAEGNLIAGSDGNLYGTSSAGGTGNCGMYYTGCGTIFRVTPSTGAYKVLFNFNLATTGAFPSGLVLMADGSFFGLDFQGSGQSLFHFTPSTGAFETFPVNFPSPNGLPTRGSMLTLGPNGNFYGLYHIYGTSGLGVFEVETNGTNLQLFPFYTKMNGGGSPLQTFFASDGNFWVVNYNGASGYGDLIALSPSDGSLVRTLSPFSATAAVGSYPAGVIQTKDGTFWGSTYGGGKATKGHFADGTVFSLNAGLPPL